MDRLHTTGILDDEDLFPDLDLDGRVLVVGPTLLEVKFNTIEDAMKQRGSNSPNGTYSLRWAGRLAGELRKLGIRTDLLSACNGQNPTLAEIMNREYFIDNCSIITHHNYKRPTVTIRKSPEKFERETKNLKATECVPLRQELTKTLEHMITKNNYSFVIVLDICCELISKDTIGLVLKLSEHWKFKVLTDCHEDIRGFVDNTANNYTGSAECIDLPHEQRISRYIWKDGQVFTYRRNISTKFYDVDTSVSEERCLTIFSYGLAIGLPIRNLSLAVKDNHVLDFNQQASDYSLTPVQLVQKCGRVIHTKEHVERLKHLLAISNTKLTLTTGCFDIFHSGHAAMIEEAKAQGDILVVALNSDNSIKQLKGDDRPICTLRERLSILLAMKYVDFVVTFEETRPDWIIDILKPDVFAKGSDYTIEYLRKGFPQLENVRVHICKPSNVLHSSGMVEKCKKMGISIRALLAK